MADVADFEKPPQLGKDSSDRSSESFRKGFWIVLALLLAAMLAFFIVFG